MIICFSFTEWTHVVKYRFSGAMNEGTRVIVKKTLRDIQANEVAGYNFIRPTHGNYVKW